jgi:polar amino acid transport system substrate-binding protein
MKHRLNALCLLVVASLLMAACAPAATPAPAAPAVPQPTVAAATVAAAPTNTPEPAPTAEPTAVPATPTAAAPTPVANVPADALAQKNHLLICSDLPYPPQEFFDDNGDPQGLDIEIGMEIANRLGLKGQVVNSVFDTIIAAVTSGKCDIIISAQNITADRQKQVSMIPYFLAGQSLVVTKGNPNKINDIMDVCGQSVAAESGTTEVDHLNGTGDYKKDGGLVTACEKAGKKAPSAVVTQKDSDALQQLQANKVVAYFTDSPVAGYYTVQHPDQFEVTGKIVDPVAEGISVPCGQADCTKAPLTPLGQAVQSALKSMMTDGTYAKILDKWKLSNGAVNMP